MKTGIIYRHVFPNGKCYVGKTERTIKERTYKTFKAYRKHKILWDAIQHFGVDSITTEVLHTAPVECLSTLEQIAIRQYRSHISQNGYNGTWGGEGMDSEMASRLAKERLDAGTHHWLGENNPVHQQIKNGTHNFLDDEIRKKARIYSGYTRRQNFKAQRRERYRLFASLLFTKALCEIYRHRQLTREGFFDKEIPDTSQSEQLSLL